MSDRIRFLLDGETVELRGVDPTRTVLDWLRYEARRTGTKEGCAEGDCGACTVMVGELRDGAVDWRAVNACIAFLPSLDGKALMTVESLGGSDPVQTAMVASHGSQCGFCTPGIVMSLHALHRAGGAGDPARVREALAGNLCRCTGYGPILAAAEAAAGAPPAGDSPGLAERLAAIAPADILALDYDDPLAGRRSYFAPRTLGALAELALERPDAVFVAGGTDVGLWVAKQRRRLGTVISTAAVEELRRLEETAEGLRIGAAVTYSEAREALAALYPDMGLLLRRLGSVQVRNSGTVGGNIANGSPIGDMAPALIAAGAVLLLRRGRETRSLPLEDYFLAYGRQDRRSGEFVEAVLAPRAPSQNVYKLFKISKRFDQDISAVMGAFNIGVEEGVVSSARIAFGGMAGTPSRARSCEAALIGRPWTWETAERAAAALEADFTPLGDLRASAGYRMAAAKNLLLKTFVESTDSSAETRVAAHG